MMSHTPAQTRAASDGELTICVERVADVTGKLPHPDGGVETATEADVATSRHGYAEHASTMAAQGAHWLHVHYGRPGGKERGRGGEREGRREGGREGEELYMYL